LKKSGWPEWLGDLEKKKVKTSRRKTAKGGQTKGGGTRKTRRVGKETRRHPEERDLKKKKEVFNVGRRGPKGNARRERKAADVKRQMGKRGIRKVRPVKIKKKYENPSETIERMKISWGTSSEGESNRAKTTRVIMKKQSRKTPWEKKI